MDVFLKDLSLGLLVSILAFKNVSVPRDFLEKLGNLNFTRFNDSQKADSIYTRIHYFYIIPF